MNRLLTTVMVCCVLALPMAVPASAQPPAAAEGLFAGSAEIGKYFDASDPCDKSGLAIVQGRGLYNLGVDGLKTPVGQMYLPGIVAPRENRGVYALSARYTMLQSLNANKANPVVDLDAGVLNLCGYLAPVAQTGKKNTNRHSGWGAACDWVKGHHGQGQLVSDVVGLKAKLFNVGWVHGFFLGAAFPVVGRFTEYIPGTSTKKKSGEFLAMFTAGGPGTALDCAGAGNGGNGAEHVTMTAVFALINGMPSIDLPNFVTPAGDDTKKCKGDGNPGGPDESHEFKPDASPGNCPTFKPEP